MKEDDDKIIPSTVRQYKLGGGCISEKCSNLLNGDVNTEEQVTYTASSRSDDATVPGRLCLRVNVTITTGSLAIPLATRQPAAEPNTCTKNV